LNKNILILLFIISSSLFAQTEMSNIAIAPGAFSRMGFGARGMGMGNAMSAVTDGNIVSYYNPALAAFQEGNSFQTSYSFLSLDRSLNFLNFTKKFNFGTITDANGTRPRSIAGVSVGIINSGVSGIQERDNQGNLISEISTSENQFFLGLSNRFSSKLAIGISFKFYYYSLYEEVSTTAFGFDIGAIYSFNENLSLSVMLSDINSKYKWDTSDLYGSEGLSTTDRFPILKKVGLSYRFEEPRIIAAVELENSNAQTNYLRCGAEYNIFEGFYLRGGIDKFDLNNFDFPVRPSLGFSYFYTLNSLVIGVDYAFVSEPYSSSDQHIIGIILNF